MQQRLGCEAPTRQGDEERAGNRGQAKKAPNLRNIADKLAGGDDQKAEKSENDCQTKTEKEEKEKEEDAIFELASGGFESTVRLAKSNPAMWVPIFKQNRENVLDVLKEHILQLQKFKDSLEQEDFDQLTRLISDANKIKRILK